MVANIRPGPANEQQNAGATPLKCPRCDSPNTKFCYYNNYSLAQPRHFCKSCKRYWTRGGTLRNVPVGGGSRKNKRTKKQSRSAISAATAPPLPLPPVTNADLSPLFYCSPAINSATVLLPKFDLDSHFACYEGSIHSCLGANLADLQKSATEPKSFLEEYSLFSSQIRASSLAAEGYRPLFSYDELPTGVLQNNSSERSIQWQALKEATAEPMAGAGVAGSDTSYFYWNQAVSEGWPESCSSMAPLQ